MGRSWLWSLHAAPEDPSPCSIALEVSKGAGGAQAKSRGCQGKPSSHKPAFIYRSWRERAPQALKWQLAGYRRQGAGGRGRGEGGHSGGEMVEVQRPGGICVLESQGSSRKQ